MCKSIEIDVDGERDLCRQILIIAIKDAISVDNKKYAIKNRKNAIRWFKSKDESKMFSFNRIIEYIYGENADVDAIRNRILRLIRTTRISGVKNLRTIFDKITNE